MSKYKYEGNSIKLNEYLYFADLSDGEVPEGVRLFYGPFNKSLADSSTDGSFLRSNTSNNYFNKEKE